MSAKFEHESECTAPAAPFSSHEVLDTAALLDRCMNDRCLASQLLQMFRGRVAQYIELIEQNLAAGDPSGAAACAHSLKGEAGSVGAKLLQQAASILEKQLKLGIAADCNSLVIPVHAALRDFLQVFPAAVDSLTSDEQLAGAT